MGTQDIPLLMRGIQAVRADGSNPAALFAKLNTAFEEFKAKNDAALDELRRGRADVVRTEEVNRINSSITEVQAELDKLNLAVAAAQMGAGQKVKDPEYNAAFLAHMRKGDVKAALDKGTAENGGYLTPIEWDRTIISKMQAESPMRSLASVQQISGTGFSKVYEDGEFGSGWVGETAPRPETSTPSFKAMTFLTGEIYANPATTQQFLDDASIDIEEWLAASVKKKFAKEESLAFVAGNGVNKPFGLLAYAPAGVAATQHPFGAVPTTTAASATVITADELLDMAYAVPTHRRSGCRYAMNLATIGRVRKLKDADGNYLWAPGMQADQPATVFNHPLTELPEMPDVATGAIPVVFGDFSEYLIVDRMGVRVLRDPYTHKPYVHFYTTKRVGGGVTDTSAFRFLRMA